MITLKDAQAAMARMEYGLLDPSVDSGIVLRFITEHHSRGRTTEESVALAKQFLEWA